MSFSDLEKFVESQEFVEEIYFNSNGETMDVVVFYFSHCTFSHLHKEEGLHLLIRRSKYFILPFYMIDRVRELSSQINFKWSAKRWILIGQSKKVRYVDASYQFDHVFNQEDLANFIR